MNILKNSFIFVLLLLFSVTIFASKDTDVLKITSQPLQTLNASEEIEISLNVSIQKGWHINSNDPLNDFLIPTSIRAKNDKNLKISKIIFPEHKVKSLKFSKSELAIFEGEIEIKVFGKLEKDLEQIDLIFKYQACCDTYCLSPAELIVTINSQTTSVKSSIFDIKKSLFDKGLVLTLLLIFLAGLALNLTPCVYPIIPITIAYFGGQEKGEKQFFNSFKLSLLYVFGIVLIYSILGIIAGLTGQVFGSLLSSPPVVFVLATIIIFMALSMFGLFELKVPQFVSKIQGKKGFFGAFLMGITVGFIAAPCVGPFIIGLLTFVADTKNAGVGFLMFFFLALGLSFPYIFLATFSSLIKNLPKTAEWTIWIKKLFGFILVFMAFYVLSSILATVITHLLYFFVLISAAIYLGFVDIAKIKSANFRTIIKIIAVIVIVLSFYQLRFTKTSDVFKDYSKTEFNNALTAKNYIILDFYSDWCLPCKELKYFTFSDEKVKEELKKIYAFKIDVSKQNEDLYELAEKYEILGVPTVIFIGKDGEEIVNLRVVGYVDAKEFLSRLKKLQDG